MRRSRRSRKRKGRRRRKKERRYYKLRGKRGGETGKGKKDGRVIKGLTFGR